ncbi:hypothetical protein [Micromonospora zamorensis]|uniref:hypothetical protein n=1 Tax=Micromonospora zamorensis TaxID=709883 RepID=UPI0037B060A5
MSVALSRPPGYTGRGPIRVAAAVVRGEITWTTACTLVVAIEVGGGGGEVADRDAGWLSSSSTGVVGHPLREVVNSGYTASRRISRPPHGVACFCV